jgi:putative transport protein
MRAGAQKCLTHLMATVLISLFSIIALGMLIGALRYRGIALGTAAVFFVALVAGHFKVTLPAELTELGLALFVYSVGLQAGPRFFSVLKARGGAFLTVGLASTLAGAGATMLLALLLKLPAHVAAGMYCGAGTCTPALAGVLDVVARRNPAGVDAASVGYAAAYPFSVLAVVLTVQWLPRLLRTSARAAGAAYQAEQASRTPPLEECAFRITNPNCVGMTITEFQSLHMTRAVICRIKHDGEISAARLDAKLNMGDVVLAVGTPNELAKLEHVLGCVAAEPMYDPTGNIASELVVVSHRSAVGKAMRDVQLWERFGVVATRVRREGIEITPHGDLVLELGDVLRLVGARRDVHAAAAVLGRQERRLDETSFIPFAAGLALGATVGLISIPIPGGIDLRLGLSGGVLLVALLLGHLGHVGPMRLHVPNAAKHFARELGLVMFLAGAGTGAGRAFVPVLQEAGPSLPLAGAAVTLTMIAAAALMMFAVFRWNVLYGAGALSACMTNPPGLAAATQMSETDAAAVGFASVYPIALLGKIMFATIVYLSLCR